MSSYVNSWSIFYPDLLTIHLSFCLFVCRASYTDNTKLRDGGVDLDFRTSVFTGLPWLWTCVQLSIYLHWSLSQLCLCLCPRLWCL